MADPVDSIRPEDGMLVAYIDGELDAGEALALERKLSAEPALIARMAELRRGGRDFGKAYDLLLAAAPTDRLRTTVRGLAARPSAGRTPLRVLAAIAAAIVIFAVGTAAGYLGPRLTGIGQQAVVEPQPPNWRQVVAEYVTLTTSDTLNAVPVDQALLDRQVAALSKQVSLPISSAKLALPHAYLKKAEAFEFRGRPLVQFGYLSPEVGPIAFCIIVSGRPDAAPAFEQREGSNIVFWTRDGRGYMLIGKAPRDALEQFAGDLAKRLT
jgi:anti-sigma factor RsiW